MSQIAYPHDEHNRIVESLASESNVPFEEVARLYEFERAKLAVGAQIKAYLPILTARNVRKILGTRRSANTSAQAAWTG
jgi:hypothetical protein